MPRTIGQCPVDYKLLNDPKEGNGYRAEVSDDGVVEVLKYLVRWEDSTAFINFVAGWIPGQNSAFTRGPRLQSPFWPGIYARRVQIEGMGADERVTRNRPWSRIAFAVEFGPLPFGVEGDQAYLEVATHGASSLATRPNASSYFQGNNERIDFDSGVWIGQTAYEFKYHQVVNYAPLKAKLESLKGKISSQDMTIDTTLHAAGTLLIPTYDTSQTTATMGQVQRTASVTILARSIPWNSAVRSDGTVDAVLPPPYPQPADFSGLLQL